jgi:aspartyl-tRNA(Asn)/glutamyl-tRNA(Gln) amidotransferase subunit A
LKDARLLVLETIALDDLQDTPRDAFEAAVAKLEMAGASITRGSFPPLNDAFNLAGTLYAAESYGWWRDKVEAAPEKMFPQILERVRGGRSVGAADFVAGWNRLRDIRAAYLKATAGFDAVIMPTAPVMPPNMTRLLQDEAYYRTQNLLALRNTRIGNLMDLVSLTLPVAVPSCGIMFNMPKGDEGRLLRLGAAAERVVRD